MRKFWSWEFCSDIPVWAACGGLLYFIRSLFWHFNRNCWCCWYWWPSTALSIMQSWNQTSQISDMSITLQMYRNMYRLRGFLSFFVTSAEFSLLKASVNYLTITVVAARMCCSPLASLWTGFLYSKQASSKFVYLLRKLISVSCMIREFFSSLCSSPTMTVKIGDHKQQ